ncbi:tRNA dihydrouridine synthase DusB [Myxococcota bacterium]|nr:tRNA dihydrouridine synthase DusB [Myxococcota bacterium]MBU1382545.1 tRNA dihydrouridine synthase DusB [Myxococcota bacterium]MBU1497437.1 tRNA dihydrouridine synthase DusB [Myxococcota bacterium]
MIVNPVKVGSVNLNIPVLLAPMAAITTPAVRILAEECGAEMTFTEMISAAALFRGVRAARNLIRRSSPGKVFAVQLFGSDPHEMGYSAWYLKNQGAQYIDINMGCPMKDIVSNGSGAALMKTPELASDIVKVVIDSVKDEVPVTVKIRAGWDFDSLNAVPFAQLMEKSGARAITVHGRTRNQLYTGKSNPQVIRDVKNSVSIPVFANGDIKTAADAMELIRFTKADGVMVARGSFGNPWIFRDIRKSFETGHCVETPVTSEEKLQMILRHLEMIEISQDADSLAQSRKQIAWYSKNLHDSSSFREMVFSTSDIQSLKKLASELFSKNVN